MKVSLPYYLVGLFAAFVYAAIKHYVPELPLSEEQVVYVIVAILAALNVDIAVAAKNKTL